MRKRISPILLVLFAVSAVACAPMGKKEKARIKCPACGYEFVAPTGGA